MIATDLLDRVRSAGGELEARGDRLTVRAPAPLPDDLLKALRAHKTEILAALRVADPQPPASLEADTAASPVPVTFRRRISQARDWEDLHALLADAQIGYSAGDLCGEEVEALARKCREASHGLPLRADPCHGCGGRNWWTSCWDGRYRCRTCEPPSEGDEA